MSDWAILLSIAMLIYGLGGYALAARTSLQRNGLVTLIRRDDQPNVFVRKRGMYMLAVADSIPEEEAVRIVLVIFVAFVWILGAAVPVAADRPDRIVISPDGFVLPAGFGCSFAVSGTPDLRARQTFTTFSDGRVQIVGHATPTFTNLDTGATYVQRSRYQATETYDPVTNVIVTEVSGRFFGVLFPGDVGPDGLVGPPGQFVGFVGHIRFTIDPDRDLVTSWEHTGTSTDICAELSD